MIANYNNGTADTQHPSVDPSDSSLNSSFSINQNEPPSYLFEHHASDDEYYASLASELINQTDIDMLPINNGDILNSSEAISTVEVDNPKLDQLVSRLDSSNAKPDGKVSETTPTKKKKSSKTKKKPDSDLSSCAVDKTPPKTIETPLKANVTAAAKNSVYPPKFVVQQNRLLEAFKDLNLYERRLFLYLSTIVRGEIEKDPTQNTFLVDIMTFARAFKIERGHHLYGFMRQAGKDMQKKTFEYTLEEDGYVDDVDVNFAFRFRYRPETAQMWVSLSSEVIEMLTVFDSDHPFTRYELNDVLHMKNRNTITLFELLIRYRKVGKRSMSIEYLRKIFHCEEKYPNTTDFIRYVIKKSAKEITELTDYRVNVKIEKEGGTPTGVVFTFKNLKKEMYKKGKELALVDFNYETAAEISKHNVAKAAKLKPNQLHRIASRKAFVNDHQDQVSPNSEHNQSPQAYISHMIERMNTDASFVKKHTLDYYLEQEEAAFS